MGIFLNISHGACEYYGHKKRYNTVVPDHTVIVFLQTHPSFDFLNPREIMFGASTRAPIVNRNGRSFPTVVRDYAMHMIKDRTFQWSVLHSKHEVERNRSSRFGFFQYKVFVPGDIVPNVRLDIRDPRPNMAEMNFYEITTGTPRSLAKHSTNHQYYLSDVVEYARELDAMRNQYTILFSFSCLNFDEIPMRKRSLDGAFRRKIDGRSFQDLFVTGHFSPKNSYMSQRRNQASPNRNKPTSKKPKPSQNRHATQSNGYFIPVGVESPSKRLRSPNAMEISPTPAYPIRDRVVDMEVD